MPLFAASEAPEKKQNGFSPCLKSFRNVVGQAEEKLSGHPKTMREAIPPIMATRAHKHAFVYKEEEGLTHDNKNS